MYGRVGGENLKKTGFFFSPSKCACKEERLEKVMHEGIETSVIKGSLAKGDKLHKLEDSFTPTSIYILRANCANGNFFLKNGHL